MEAAVIAPPKPTPSSTRLASCARWRTGRTGPGRAIWRCRAQEAHITRFSPQRGTSQPASGPTTSEASGIGRTNRPAFSGVRPCTSCRCWLNTSSMPTSAMVATVATATPRAKRRLRNSAKSIIGSRARRWRRTNRYRQSMPPSAARTASPKSGARVLSSLIAYTTPTRPNITCSEPRASHGRRDWPPQAGMSRQRQQQSDDHHRDVDEEHRAPPEELSSTPPTTGPSAAPAEATEAQMPMARARSRSSRKTWRTIDRVAGIISAAPTANPARAATGAAALGAKAAHSEARPNSGRPARNSRLWPRRSLSAGAGQQAGDHQRIGVDDPEPAAVAPRSGSGAAGPCRARSCR